MWKKNLVVEKHYVQYQQKMALKKLSLYKLRIS
jgi:hypothetical protein